MEAHKPERKDEKERIEALGGRVIWFGAWRVNGNLAVSRAIGEFSHLWSVVCVVCAVCSVCSVCSL